MIAELQGYALLWRSSHRLFHRALKGVSPAQAAERPAGGGNSVLWIAAHVVSVRHQYARALGATLEVPWTAQFPRGGSPGAVTEWPALEEVRARWDEVHAAFMARIEALTADRLAEKTTLHGLDDTLLGALGLAALHDLYHVGQLGAARARLGLDRMVG